MKYVCELCGTVYDEALGDARGAIAPGTPFASIPQHWACPGCGCGKEAFNPHKAPEQPTAPPAADRFWQDTKYADAKTESER